MHQEPRSKLSGPGGMVTRPLAGARSVSVPTGPLQGCARRVRRPAAHSHPGRGRRGFTLIELLLVLAILAALAAMVVPKFTRRSQQAKITAAQVDISNLEVALDAFEVDCGRFPTSQEGLSALVEQPSDSPDWMGPYIKRGVPKDPWGNPYQYRYPGQQNTHGYDLYSFGPDGRSGGDDDIDNWSER